MEIFVNGSGASPGSGTQDDPFVLIQSAVDASSPGDTIIVQPGRYAENIVVDHGINIVSSDGAGGTTIDGSMTGTVIDVSGGQATRIGGLTIENGFGIGGGGIRCTLTPLVIEDCMIRCNAATPQTIFGGAGVYALVGTGDLELRRTVVRENTPIDIGAGAAGVLALGFPSSSPGSVVIDHCRIEENEGIGVSIGGVAGGFVSRSHIVGNADYQVAAGSVSVTLDSCVISGGPGAVGAGLTVRQQALVTNCVIADTAVDPSSASAPANGCAIVGVDHAVIEVTATTIANNEGLPSSLGSGIFLEADAVAHVTDSILWNNGPTSLYGGTLTVEYSNVEGGAVGTGNIDIDPEFEDAQGRDYHLQSISPCVNAGSSTPTVAVDIDGETRPAYGRGDMGADEYVGLLGDCALGTVMDGSGDPVDVLTVDGSSGGFAREVPLLGSSTTLHVAAPPNSVGQSNFVIWGLLGIPVDADRLVTPLGELCFAPPGTPASSPLAFTFANNLYLGAPPQVGSGPAPWGITCPVVVPQPSMTFQGVIEDPSAPMGLALTNALIVRCPSPAPVITDLTPPWAPPGGVVAVVGENFDSGATILVGDMPATVVASSPESVQFVVPPGACDAPVAVVHSNGDTAMFEVLNKSPQIGSSFLAAGPDVGGALYYIYGTFDVPIASVEIDGQAATLLSSGDHFIEVLTPPGAAGVVPVVVTNAAGCTSTTSYEYVSGPQIMAIAPTWAPPGGTVSVLGTGFDPMATVEIEGVPAPVVSSSSTSIEFVVPSSPPACDALVTVTNPDGLAGSIGGLNPAPDVVMVFSVPTQNLFVAAGSFVVPVTSVTFDGVAGTIFTQTPTTTSAIPPPGSGTVDVVLTNAAGCSTATTYTYP